jgi:hypothetical protein
LYNKPFAMFRRSIVPSSSARPWRWRCCNPFETLGTFCPRAVSCPRRHDPLMWYKRNVILFFFFIMFLFSGSQATKYGWNSVYDNIKMNGEITSFPITTLDGISSLTDRK